MTKEESAAQSRRFSIIDHIYELLEKLDEDIRQLQRATETDLIYYNGVVEAVNFLDGNGFGSRLGLSAMDLSKFRRWRGEVGPTNIAKVAHRAHSLLREMEGEVKGLALKTPDEALAETSVPTASLGGDLVPVVQPMKWVALPRRANAELIAEISSLLDEAVYLARSTNLPPDKAALTDIERAQLIALLETALALLKAPLVEKGMLKRAAEAAKSGAVTAVQRKSEIALGYALGKLAEAMAKLWGLL